ncbi:MAG TPA: TIM44-like domain-containing protein [Nitrospiraceae bacterium]|nr:TIM44-like domain-containing protein [Nitrospiraceae bacterium]
MNTTRITAALIVIALIGVPTVSFAKARGGGFGGGFSGGPRGYSGSESMGSRGSRTYDQNGAKPIEQSTTPRPAATAPPSAAGNPTAQPVPAMQPSFMQRNPLLAGLAAGVMGSYIGHMLFGATESSARTTDAGEAVGETNKPTEGFGSSGILLILMLIGAGAFYYFVKVRRRPTPDFSGITRSNAFSGTLMAEPSPTMLSTATVDNEITSADKAAFQQLLTDIQTAWSKQDLAGLRRFVTPEMLAYFSTALAEQTSLDIANHVEDVVLLRAEVKETWTEDAICYATIGLHWSARDYTVSLTKQRGEPGYLIEGNEETPTETGEVWTFMRYQNGKWLLSAIQQL